jgi:hypothetical protein
MRHGMLVAGDPRQMSNVETLNVMARNTVHERDSLVWQATLAAARRVTGYYASKAEASAGARNDAGSSSTRRTQLTPESRLAA